MQKINKYQTGIILLAVALGLLSGNLAILERYASSFIVPLLMVMLYGLFLSIDRIKKADMSVNPENRRKIVSKKKTDSSKAVLLKR